MRVSFFKLNKNRRFNYTPRYYRSKEVGNIYEIGSRIEKQRNTVNSGDFGTQWKEARVASRHRGNRSISLRLLIIILTLVLIFLYIIDFDLSIFKQQ